MESWDLIAQKHLSTATTGFSDSGCIDLIRAATTETWRANRERFEPDDLYDDASTLGYQTSKNLANRIYDYLGPQRRLQHAGVSVTWEQNVVVVHSNGFDLRIVKAPSSAGRLPNFTHDFSWRERETRFAAAARNARGYRAPKVAPGMDPLFEIHRPGAIDAIQDCRDVFLVWSADITSGLTGGWLGLPTTHPGGWLAVESLWWDEGEPLNQAHSDANPGPTPEFDFRNKQAPKPVVTLKPRPYREISQ